MERTHTFWYKKASVKKHNKYIYAICCDKDGFVLRNKFPEVPEFWEQISDATLYYSEVLTNAQGMRMGLGELIKKFKKVIDPESLFVKVKNTNFPRFKAAKNLYYYQALGDALYREEIFFDGLIWWFGNMEFLHDLKSVVDEVRVCRCDVSFKELYPDEVLDLFNLDEWLAKHNFDLTQEHETDKSKENRKLITLKASKTKVKVKEEILGNGMRIIHQEPKVKNLKLPDIPTYKFCFYQYRTPQV